MNDKDRGEVGNLQEISFANTKAYRFTLTKGFHSLSIDYTLPRGNVFNYLITENLIGQKMIIHYLLGNEVSEKMIQSFQFIYEDKESEHSLLYPNSFGPLANVYENKEFSFSLKYPDELIISMPDCVSLNDKKGDGIFGIKICNQNSPLSFYNPNFHSLDDYKNSYILKTEKETKALRIYIRKNEEIITSQGVRGLKQIINVEVFDPTTGASTPEMRDAFWFNQKRYVFFKSQKGMVELLIFRAEQTLLDAIIQSISF